MISDKAVPVVIVTAIFCSVAVVSTVVRCLVRRYIVKKVGRDDYLMIVASMAFIWYSVVVQIGAYYGLGYRTRDLSDRNAERTYLMWWIGYISYSISITLTRVSIGFFFYRIATMRLHFIVIRCNIGVNILAGTIYLSIVVFQCTPVPYYWMKAHSGTTGHCVPNKALVGLGYLYGSVCAACDIVFVVLPFLIIRGSGMERSLKFALIPILGMAGIAAICPLTRMAYMHNLASPDFIHDTTDLIIWSSIEPGLAITANNLATMRPLFQRLASRMHSRRTTGSNSTLTNRARAVVRSLETIKVGMTLESSISRGWGESMEGLTRETSSGGEIRVQTDIEVRYDEDREQGVASWWERWRNRWSVASVVRWLSLTTRATGDEEMTALPRI